MQTIQIVEIALSEVETGLRAKGMGRESRQNLDQLPRMNVSIMYYKYNLIKLKRKRQRWKEEGEWREKDTD